MLLLLPMIGAYMPISIIEFITGMDFALFSFSFISLNQLLGISSINTSRFPQTDTYLSTIGLESSSCILNNLSIFFSICLLLATHLVLYLFLRKFKELEDKKWYHKVVERVYEMMTYSVYVRIGLEAYLFVGVGATEEIKRLEVGNVGYVISLLTSFVIVAG
jgi:hypothetical protein